MARTLDSRVIFVHKVALDELDGKGRFSNTWEREERMGGLNIPAK